MTTLLGVRGPQVGEALLEAGVYGLGSLILPEGLARKDGIWGVVQAMPLPGALL